MDHCCKVRSQYTRQAYSVSHLEMYLKFQMKTFQTFSYFTPPLAPRRPHKLQRLSVITALCVDCSPAQDLYASFQSWLLRLQNLPGRTSKPQQLRRCSSFARRNVGAASFCRGRGGHRRIMRIIAALSPIASCCVFAWPARALWDTESFGSFRLSAAASNRSRAHALQEAAWQTNGVAAGWHCSCCNLPEYERIKHFYLIGMF